MYFEKTFSDVNGVFRILGGIILARPSKSLVHLGDETTVNHWERVRVVHCALTVHP